MASLPGRGRPSTQEHYEAIARASYSSVDAVKSFFSRPGKLSPERRREIALAVAAYGWRPATRRQGPLAGAAIGYELARSWTAPNPVFVATMLACTVAIERAGGTLAPFVVDPEIPGYTHVVPTPGDEGRAHEEWLFRFANELAPRVYEKVFSQRRLRAFVVDDPRAADPRLALLDAQAIPYVVIGTPEHPDRRFHADIDDAAGFEAMVRHLLDAGCPRDRVAHYGFADDSTMVPGRRRAVVAHALGLPERRVRRRRRPYQARDDSAEAARLVQWLRDVRPAAVVCDSDDMAALVAEAASRADRRVSRHLTSPADLLLAGCDDTPARRSAAVPWMSLRQPADEWADVVVGLLGRAVQGEPPRRVLVPPRVVDPVH